MFTDIFRRCLILEIFVMGLVSMDCPNIHLQTQYCNSEVVFSADRPEILSKTGPYEMTINMIYKGNSSLQKITTGNSVLVETNMVLNNVTDEVLPDKNFVVFGQVKDGKVDVGGCIQFYPYRWLKSYQKTAMLNKYKRGCDCIDEIDSEPELGCEYFYSMMAKKNGACTWIKTKPLQICKQIINWARGKMDVN